MSKDNSKVLFSTSMNKNLRDRFKIQCVLHGKFQNEVLEELIEKWLNEEKELEDQHNTIEIESEDEISTTSNESVDTSQANLKSEVNTDDFKKDSDRTKLNNVNNKEVNNGRNLADVEIPECYDF